MKSILRVIFFGIMAVAAAVTVCGIVWVGIVVKDLVYAVADTIGEEPDTAVGDYAIGLMYEYGSGVDEDKAEAVQWYSMAAEKGHADAQFQLAGMYDKGEGVPEDVVAGYAWLSVAAASGRDDLRKKRDIIKDGLTPSQIEKGEALAREISERIKKRKAAEAE